HPGESTWRPRTEQLRPLSAGNQDPPQGDQGRLASVRTELLPPLPAGRAPRRASRYIHEPRRLSLHHSQRETGMSSNGNRQDTTASKSPLNRRNVLLGSTTLAAASAIGGAAPVQVAQAQAQPAPAGQRPNILVIWGDDVGVANVSAYSFGLMGYKTPNIDRIAREGLMFTDYYAEQSCTAGRASFITGQSGLRTGMTKVGLPGAALGLPA